MVNHLVVIPCGAKKRQGTHPAQNLYVGSYFTTALNWARTRQADRVLILSAKHGLIELHDVIDDYEQTFGKPGSITAAQVWAQAEQKRLLNVTKVETVGGNRYRSIVRYIWPHATSPVDNVGGMGHHMRAMSQLAKQNGTQS